MKITKNLSNKSLILLLRNPENLKYLIEQTSYLPENISVSERAYCWKNDIIEIPKCPICGKPRKFYKMCLGYFPSCGSKECASQLRSQSNIETGKTKDYTEQIEKRKQTYAKDHNGIEHNMQDPDFKKKFFENKKKSKKEKSQQSEKTKICKKDKDYLKALNLDQLIGLCRKNEISNRQLMFYAEKYSQEIFEKTAFLDRYDADWLERLYNILHGYRDIVKCKYCGEKAIWSGRMTYGYKEICSNKQCRSKQLTEAALGKTIISENRNKKFTDSIKDIVEVDDNVILKLIKYER